jgi:CRP-like cAMP-binding protein
MQSRGPAPDNPAEKRICTLLDRFASGEVRRYAANEAIFKAGDEAGTVFMLREGQVDVGLSVGDRPLFRRIAYPGFLLGAAATLTNRPHNYTATAVESVLVSFLPNPEFRAYLKDNPQTCFEVAQAIATELMEIFETGVRPMRSKPRHLRPHS